MIKLGTVPFINSKPLVYGIEHGLVEHDFKIVYEVPSKLSKILFDGKIDLGLIPVAELLERRRYRVIPEICISSNGVVQSVVLVVKNGIESLRKVAIDSRSQSSTALLKIVLEIFYKLNPDYIKKDYDESFFNNVDGGMVIGNSGLELKFNNDLNYNLYDLGEIWTRETNLPFVYAVFAINKDVELGRNLKSLIDSKKLGIEHLNEISLTSENDINVSSEHIYSYLSESISYDLGNQEIEGIIRYSQYLEQLGFCKKLEKLGFYK